MKTTTKKHRLARDQPKGESLLSFLTQVFFHTRLVRRDCNMNWDDKIPKLDRAKSLDLVRTPSRSRLSGIVTSKTWTGTWTHYHAGRTNPCQKEECELCKAKVGRRWHGYIGIWQPKARRHVLFEFCALPAEALQKYVELTGNLRGCAITAERRGPRINGPVVLSCSPANIDGIALPPPPDIRAMLCIIWGLPEDCLEDDGGYAYAKLATPNQQKLDEIAGPAKDSKARAKLSA
jgi:hypothetical protein